MQQSLEVELRLLRQAHQEQGKVIGALMALIERMATQQMESEKRIARRLEQVAEIQADLVIAETSMNERLARLATLQQEHATSDAHLNEMFDGLAKDVAEIKKKLNLPPV
jgi:hypothetical protein